MFGLGFGHRVNKTTNSSILTRVINAFWRRTKADGAVFESLIGLRGSLTKHSTASIIITPHSYKNGELKAIKPTDESANLSYTQNTANGSRFNQTGEIESVPVNTPRITWVDGAPYFLAQKSKTNLIPYSNPVEGEGFPIGTTYESYSWTNGFSTCIRIADNATTRFWYNGSVNADNFYQIACFVEMDDGSEPMLGSTSSDDFALRVGGSSNITNYSKEKLPNSNVWFVQGGRTSTIDTTSNGVLKSTSNTNKGFRVTGFLLVQGEVTLIPEDFIQTNGSTKTRNDDLYKKYGITDKLGQSSGHIEIKFTPVLSVNEFIFELFNDAETHGFNLFKIGGNNLRLATTSPTGGFQVSVGDNLVLNQENIIHLIYTQELAEVWINGSLECSIVDPEVNELDNMVLGNKNETSLPLGVFYKSISIFK